MTEAAMLDVALSSASPDADVWEDPPHRPPEHQSPVLVVEGFEGPLDWLLEMARASKLDLQRLSILALIDCFADLMQAALPPGASAPVLTHWAGWTVIATQLAEIRSRLLLLAAADAKRAQTEVKAPQRHELGRAEMLAAADWLEQRPQLGQDVFARGRPEPGRTGQGTNPRRATNPSASADAAAHDGEDLAAEEDEHDELTELLRACLVALRLPAHAVDYQPRELPFWSVGDAAARIRRMIQTLPDGALLEAFLPEIPSANPGFALRSKAAHAATLIAGLELARDGGITLDQDALWQPIHVA